MKLFIQIREGQPYEHPVMEGNMKQLFPSHDLETAPNGFAKFTRVVQPTIGAYEKFDESLGHIGCGCVYESDGFDGYKDVWHTLPLTPEEKEKKMADVKDAHSASWIFNETDCTCSPPVEYPSDGGPYLWDEVTISWVTAEEM